jgi:PQQ-dependent catabolism-associated CXXCW motif protein
MHGHLVKPFLAAALALALAGGALAQPAAGGKYFADEDRDWGIAPTSSLRPPPFHGPTPREIPGARVVSTLGLQAMLAGPDAPVLIDVLSDEGHVTLAGAVWLPGAGRGANFMDPIQAALIQRLGQISGGDKARPIVFFCAGSECWLSYNAALRAAAAGYSNVHWYRGGVEAWMAAGLPVARTVRGN